MSLIARLNSYFRPPALLSYLDLCELVSAALRHITALADIAAIGFMALTIVYAAR